MSESAVRRKPRKRTESKALRRQQLIDSTIESIAKRGFAETTLADVASGAGLSRGIVNFHFESKEQLLIETLRFVSEEYRQNWQKALARAGGSAIERLLALINADFEPAVCNRKKVAVWYAFWGEAKSRPTYLKLCADRDQDYGEMMRALIQDIVEEGPYPAIDPDLVVTGIAAMTDGLWLDVLLEPKAADRRRAVRSVMLFLAGLFPRHLNAQGEIKAQTKAVSPAAAN